MKPANNVFETLFQMTNSKKNVVKVFQKRQGRTPNGLYLFGMTGYHTENRKVETLIELYALPKDLSVVLYHELGTWLSKFVVECRRKDGKPYPPTSLTQIMAAIQRHMRDELGRNDVNFFSKTDPTFANFRKSLDAQMKELSSKSVGIHI